MNERGAQHCSGRGRASHAASPLLSVLGRHESGGMSTNTAGPMPIDRARVAARYSAKALSRDRTYWTWLAIFLSLGTAWGIRSHGLRWPIWFPLFNLLLLVGPAAIRAWRQQPRDPETITEIELQEAIGHSRPCPKCDGRVLLSEWRCPNCGSRGHDWRIGSGTIDEWMPLAFLAALLVFIFVAAVLA